MIEASAQLLMAIRQQLTANENPTNSTNPENPEKPNAENAAVQLNPERLKIIDEISRLISELKNEFPKLAQYLSKARDNFSANQETVPTKDVMKLLTEIQQNLKKPEAVETVKNLVDELVKILQPKQSAEAPPEYKLVLALSKNDFATANVAAKNVVQAAAPQTPAPQVPTPAPAPIQTFQTILNALQELKELGIPKEFKNTPLKELETVVLQKTGIEIPKDFPPLRNLQNFFNEKPVFATISLLPANQTVQTANFEKADSVVEIPLPKDFPVQKIFSDIPPQKIAIPTPIPAPTPTPTPTPAPPPLSVPISVPISAPIPLPQPQSPEPTIPIPQQPAPAPAPPPVSVPISVPISAPIPSPQPILPEPTIPIPQQPAPAPQAIIPQAIPLPPEPTIPQHTTPAPTPTPTPTPAPAPAPQATIPIPQQPPPPPELPPPPKIEMAFSLHQITIPQYAKTQENTPAPAAPPPAPKFILQPWPVSALIPKEERNFWLKTELPLTPQILNIRDTVLSFGKLPENPETVKLFANNLHELSLQTEQGVYVSKEQANLLWRVTVLDPKPLTFYPQILKYQPTGNFEGELFKTLPEPVKRELLHELPTGKTWQPEVLQKAVEKILEKYEEPPQLGKAIQNEHASKHNEEIRQVLQHFKEQIQWTRIDQDTRVQNDRENVFYFMHEGNLQKGRLKIKDERKGGSKKQQGSSISFSIDTKTKNLGDVHADLTLSKRVLNIRLQDSVGIAGEAVKAEREVLAKELADIGITLGELLYGKTPRVRNLQINKPEEKKNSGLDLRA